MPIQKQIAYPESIHRGINSLDWSNSILETLDHFKKADNDTKSSNSIVEQWLKL